MQMSLINKLANELKEIGYKGSVVLCGYGEPMLHKDINIICKRFYKKPDNFLISISSVHINWFISIFLSKVIDMR